MLERLRRWLPTEETLQNQRGLRWLGPLLRRRALWHLSRRRVAMGAAIGVFFGFLIPIAQIAGAAVFAVLLRANLPVAAAATFVTNPVTFAPVMVLAYRTGSALLGEPASPAREQELSQPAEDDDPAAATEPIPAAEKKASGWLERLRGIGKPLVLGLVVFACVGGFLTWVLVQLVWTIAVRLKRRQRRRHRQH